MEPVNLKLEEMLKNKSDMLDEVNQLMDLMVEEKKHLNQKIVDLESKLEKCADTPTVKEDRKLEERQDEISQTPLEKPDLKWARKAIEEERQNLKELKRRVENITKYCETERGACQAMLENTKSELDKCKMALKKQTRENNKLQEEVSMGNSKLQEAKEENESILKQLEEMKTKYIRTRTSLLAVKGRTKTEEKKHNSKEREIKELDVILSQENKLKTKLKNNLEEKEKELQKVKEMLLLKENEATELRCELEVVKGEMSEKFAQLEQELQFSRKELNELKELMKQERKQLTKTHELLLNERRQSYLILTRTQSMLTQVLSQLDKERLEHQKEVHSLNVAMAMQKQEAAVQLDRLKDVSMKRCRDLAKEVWQLKSGANRI